MKVSREKEVYFKNIIKIEPDEEELEMLSNSVAVMQDITLGGNAYPFRSEIHLEALDEDTLKVLEDILFQVITLAKESVSGN